MYEVEQGKLKLEGSGIRWGTVEQPAVLFDLSRAEETAILLRHGALASVEAYKKQVEKSFKLAGVTDQSELVLIPVFNSQLDVNMQCILMNYFVEYTSSALTYALAAASSESREDAFRDILEFDEKLKSCGSY